MNYSPRTHEQNLEFIELLLELHYDVELIQTQAILEYFSFCERLLGLRILDRKELEALIGIALADIDTLVGIFKVERHGVWL